MPWLLLAVSGLAGLATAAYPCYLDANHSLPRPDQGMSLRLMKRSWVSHALVADVAAILLQEVLKFDVEVVQPSNDPPDDVQQIAEGHFDANFEFWPQGKLKEFETWTRPEGADGARAHVAEHHQVMGHMGLYTMKYTVDQHPEAAFYQHLRKPSPLYGPPTVQGEAAADPTDLCQKSEWNCSNFTWRSPACGSSCWGQVLHSRVSYLQGQMEQQIANNGLGLEVTYLTDSSLAFQMWDAFATRRNLLFEYYQPAEGVHGIPGENFVQVEFPPLGTGCRTSNSSRPDGPLSCELPERPLLKLVSSKLVSNPDALRFAHVFSLNEEDYKQLFQIWRRSEDTSDAACAWLQQVGYEKYGKWISFSKKIHLFESFPPTEGCFPAFYSFCCLGVLFFLVSNILPLGLRRQPQNEAKRPSSDLETLQQRMNMRACKTYVDLSSRMVGCSRKDHVAVKLALLKGRMNFMNFWRSEEDFCTPLGQATAPPDASSALRQLYTTKLQVLIYLFTSGFLKTCFSAVMYTCLSGAVGALLAQVRLTIYRNEKVDPQLEAQDVYITFLRSMDTVVGILTDFNFLPVFLITYMVGQDVNRWHEWLQKMLSLQGRLHDLVLLLNSSYRLVNDPKVGLQQRKAIYKWYRYVNSIHYLAYLNLVPSVGTSAEAALEDLRIVGLLRQEEVRKIQFASGKVRDTLTSWLGRLWHDELEAGNVQIEENVVFMQKLCDLRGILAGLNDMPSKPPPQMVRIMMVVVTNTLLVLALLGYPTKMYKDSHTCVQFWPLLACFLYFVCYRGMLHIMFTLDKGPFYAKGECVNVDALLISTERFAFHVFRSAFEELTDDTVHEL